MKYFFIFFIFLLAGSQLTAQDHIITKEGQDILVIIKNIGETDVTYYNFDDEDKIPYMMEKKKIKKIVFANGAEEEFGDNENETIINNQSTKRTKDPDKIYTTDGKVIYCEVVEKKRFGVNYIPTKSTDNYVEYLANTKIDRIEYANGDVDYISGTPDNEKNRKDPKDFSYLSPNYISLNVGGAFPFGLIGGSSAVNYSIISGFDVNVDFNYYLYRGLGFGLMAGYTYNPSNLPQLRSVITTDLVGYQNQNISVDGWQSGYVLAGLGYYNEYRRFMLDYKGLFGLFINAYPGATASYNDAGIDKTRRYYAPAISYSFIFGGQISARYYLTRKFQLKFNLATLFGRASYGVNGIIYKKTFVDGVQEGVDEVVTNSSGLTNPVNFSWINITLGVAYTLGK